MRQTCLLLMNLDMFPKIGVGPQNGWFILENLIKMDGVPLFLETPICIFGCLQSRHVSGQGCSWGATHYNPPELGWAVKMGALMPWLLDPRFAPCYVVGRENKIHDVVSRSFGPKIDAWNTE